MSLSLALIFPVAVLVLAGALWLSRDRDDRR